MSSAVLSLNAVPGMGSVVGSVGSDSLLSSINAEMNGSGFFGGVNDLLSAAREQFVATFVQPFRAIGDTVRNLVGILDYDEKYIPINNEELLDRIPICMHLPILQYAPVRKLFDEGRIFGFGHEYIPSGDPYGRLIDNGFVRDLQSAMNDEGEFILKYHFKSTDDELGELGFDELDSIRETRDWLDQYMKDSMRDFTDPMKNDRG